MQKLEAKLLFSPEQLAETLADLLSFLQLVRIANDLKGIAADPDDEKVLECAVLEKSRRAIPKEKGRG